MEDIRNEDYNKDESRSGNIEGGNSKEMHSDSGSFNVVNRNNNQNQKELNSKDDFGIHYDKGEGRDVRTPGL